MVAGETIAASAVLGLVLAWVFAFVGSPLLRRGGSADRGVIPVEQSAPERQLRATLSALRELDRDRELGLVTAEDYGPMRQQHEARAAVLYEAVDEMTAARLAALSVAVAEEKRRLVASNGHASGHGALTPWPPLPPAGPAATAPPAGEGEHPSGGATPSRHPAPAAPSRRSRSSRGLVVGTIAIAALFLAGVAAIWYTGAVRGPAQPIATVRAPDYHKLAFDPLSPSRLYLGTHAGLFVSDNRGAGWRPIPSAEGDVMAVVSTPGGLIAAGHDVYMRSSDGGSTWQSLKTSLPGTDIHALASAPGVPTRLYAAVVDQGVFRSDDSGQSWSRLGAMPRSITALAVVPDGEADLLYAATAQEGVLASRDGGRGWGNANGFVSGALPTTAVTDIVYDPRSGDSFDSPSGRFRGALYVATDRGAFRSIDGGSSWVRLGLDANVAAVAVAPDDSRVLLAVDQSGRLFRSGDRGVSW